MTDDTHKHWTIHLAPPVGESAQWDAQLAHMIEAGETDPVHATAFADASNELAHRLLETARNGERASDDDAAEIYRGFARRADWLLYGWAQRLVCGDDKPTPEQRALAGAVSDEAGEILQRLAEADPAPGAMMEGIRSEMRRGPHGRELAAPDNDPRPKLRVLMEVAVVGERTGPDADKAWRQPWHQAGVPREILAAALPWPWALVSAIWHDTFKPRAERARAKPTTAAPRVITEALVAAPERIGVGDAHTLTLDGVPTALRITSGMGLHAAQNMVRKTLDQAAFWSVLGWVLEAHRNQWLTSGSVNDASVIEVAGISELSPAIMGYEGKSADDRIRDALRLGQSLEVHAVQGEHAGGLWTWVERKGNRWKPALLRITLGAPLRLDAGNIMPGTMRLLAPVANPERTPSLDGFQRRMFGRLRAADQHLMNTLAERTDRAVLDGERVLIPFDRDEDRKRIASETGLKGPTSARWLERMTEGDAQGVLPPGYSGPVVRLEGHNMIEVAEPGARALLAEQATMRQQASEAGKKSARKRRSARNRHK